MRNLIKTFALKEYDYFKLLWTNNKSNFIFFLKIFSLIFSLTLIHIALMYAYDYYASVRLDSNIFSYIDTKIYAYSSTFVALIAPIFFFKRPKFYFILLFFIVIGGMLFDCFYLVKYNAFLGDGIFATLAIATFDSVKVVLSAMSWTEIIMSLLGIIISFLGFLFVCKYFLKSLAATKQSRKFAILLLLPFIFYVSIEIKTTYCYRLVQRIIEPIPVIRLYYSYRNFSGRNKPFTNVAKNPKVPENLTAKNKGILGIVVIGESATRYNHSLYGYERDTNPKLSMLKDHLVLFDDVVAKATLTREAFPYAFLLRDENKAPTASIADIMLAADFDVYYVSANSTYIDINAPQKLLFSNAKTVNPKRITGNADQDLLLYVKNNININPEKNTLVFLGLNGSHAPYKKHFPDEFKIFDDEAEVSIFKDLDKDARQVLNDYDNSLRHTDSLVFDIIDYFSASDKDTFLLYFSDHGDAPFNDRFQYRNSMKGYPYNYEIPMFLWYSENYKLHYSEIVENAYLNKSKAFQTYEALYTILELASISFDDFEYEKSLVSDKFKAQSDRYIFGKRILYDKSKREMADYFDRNRN